VVDHLEDGGVHADFVDTGAVDRAGEADQARPAALLRPELGKPLRAVLEDGRQARQRLDVVHHGRAAEEAGDGGEGGLETGPALLALDGLDEAGLLTA